MRHDIFAIDAEHTAFDFIKFRQQIEATVAALCESAKTMVHDKVRKQQGVYFALKPPSVGTTLACAASGFDPAPWASDVCPAASGAKGSAEDST